MNPIDAAWRPLSRGEVRPGDGQPGGSARWPRRWIASVVALHFLASLVAALPAESPVWRLSALRHLRLAYVSHSLDQRWTMFAPPPRQDYSIHAALRLPEGWTEMFRLDDFTSTRLRGVIFQPRGLFRLRSFLRPSSRDLDGLHDRSFRAFYYQQLADYFCQGSGRVPDLIAVRFYLVAMTPPRFFDEALPHRSLRPAAEDDFREPLYEQDCAG